MVIVAAVDDSDRADIVLGEAEKLGHAFDDAIHVIHVLTQSKYIDMGRTAAEEMDDSFDIKNVQKEASKVAAEAVSETDTMVEFVGRMGDPADEIV